MLTRRSTVAFVSNSARNENEPRWRELSHKDREREYSPSSCVGGNIEPFLRAYVQRSAEDRAQALAAGSAIREVRYGDRQANTLDLVVPTGQGSHPVVVYIHGGYWQQLSKHESFFSAVDCLSNDLAFATVDYTLAPEATLDDIVEECRMALTALRDAGADNGLDTDRFVVCGSSAGGHLSAMMGLGLADGWRPAAVVPVSGIFELEPLIGTSINEAVGLDLEAARRNSPMLAELAGFPPTVIAWGDNETDEFKRQSRHFASLLAAQGTAVETLEVEARNHFDVVLDLCNPEAALGNAVADLVDRTDGDEGTDSDA